MRLLGCARVERPVRTRQFMWLLWETTSASGTHQRHVGLVGCANHTPVGAACGKEEVCRAVIVCPEQGAGGRLPKGPLFIQLLPSTPWDRPLPRWRWRWPGLTSCFGSWDVSRQDGGDRRSAHTAGLARSLPLVPGYRHVSTPRLACW